MEMSFKTLQSFKDFQCHQLQRSSRKIFTVFIRISSRPQISAHFEEAPILKAEKVNKRPLPPPRNQTQIIAHPHPTHLSE